MEFCSYVCHFIIANHDELIRHKNTKRFANRNNKNKHENVYSMFIFVF